MLAIYSGFGCRIRFSNWFWRFYWSAACFRRSSFYLLSSLGSSSWGSAYYWDDWVYIVLGKGKLSLLEKLWSKSLGMIGFILPPDSDFFFFYLRFLSSLVGSLGTASLHSTYFPSMVCGKSLIKHLASTKSWNSINPKQRDSVEEKNS